MKKIAAFYRKFRAKLTVQMGKRPILMTMLFLAAANLVIVLIAGGIALAIDSGAYDNNYFYAAALALKWLILPSATLSITNTAMLVLAIFVAVLGMVLFTGTVIALTTNYLRNYMATKTDGRGKLALSGHIVILNYNSCVPAVLTDFMYQGIEDTVLLLSDKDREFVSAELAGEVAALRDKPLKQKLNLIVRKGNPLSASELNEINIKDAKAVLVMDNESAEDDESEGGASHYDTVKLLLRLSKSSIAPSCPIAVESESYKTAELIRYLCRTISGLQNKSVDVFSYTRKLGQMLALSALCPSVSGVLFDLLSSSGCGFYPVEPMSPEKYLQKYGGGIPVGTAEKTFAFASGTKHLKQKRDKLYKTTRRIKPLETPPAEEELNIFIIGENKKSHYLLFALQNQTRPVNVSDFAADERKQFLAALEKAPAGRTVALILSDDTAEVGSRDENVILTLIELNQKFGGERTFSIVAEISDPRNQEDIGQFGVQHLVSPSRITAFFITRILTGAGNGKFYENIFTDAFFNPESKFSLLVSDADKLLDFSQRLSFRSYAELVSSVFHGSEKTIMPVGVIRENQNIFFCSEMDKKHPFTMQETDKLIYIKYKKTEEKI